MSTATLTPIDELRKLADSRIDHRSNKSIKFELNRERAEHLLTTNTLTTEVRGREMLASEQRNLDRAHESIALIDLVLAKILQGENDDRSIQSTLARAGVYGCADDDASASGAAFGDQIRAAIGEVMEGRSRAFVDYPQTRALTESGSGGYGVTTQMGNPVETLAARSVMMGLPGVIRITATEGDRYRFPRFGAVSVAGTAEGAALNAAASDIDAVDIVYQKFSTYETISTELEEDFSADALQALGNRMLKDLGKRVDSGLIQGVGASDVVGLFAQPGTSSTSVAALPADFLKVDEAIYQMELNDGTPTAWIGHPRSWRIYNQILTGISGDKTPILQPDLQQGAKALRGLPFYSTSAISITSGATSVGSTIALVDASQLVIVTRRPPRLEISRDVAFSTDQVAIRATTRVGLGVIDAAGGISLLTDIRAS